MKKDQFSDSIIEQVEALRFCVGMADQGLQQCKKVLESLQPKQPGRISLLVETRKSTGKVVINEVRWRVVRWRIRSTQADGKIIWDAEHLTLKGASRRTSSKMNFRDTADQVKEVIRGAVKLIEWRGRLIGTGRNFVVATMSHNKLGVAGVQKLLTEVDAAHKAGHAERAAKRSEVEKIVARQKKLAGKPKV